MSQISRLKDAEISNGNLINADDLDDEFNQLVSESNSQDTRLTTIESGTLTIAGAKTFTGAIVATSTVALSVGANFAASSVPSTLTNGALIYDYNNAVWRAVTGGLETSFAPGLFPNFFKGTAAPVYASASTFTIAYLSARDTVLGSSNILKTTSTTVDISTNGTNGCAQSADLTGTIGTGGVPSTTITGSSTTFTTDFQVGDVIWTSGGARRVTNVGGNTTITVESNITISNGTTYRRGGEAPNTWYNVYIFADAFGSGTTGVLLDTRNMAGGDTNVNFSTYLYQQLPFAIRNDGSSNIIPFLVSAWGHRPMVYYDVLAPQEGSDGTCNVVSGGTSTSYSTVSLANFVPPISKLAYIAGFANGTNRTVVRPTSASHNGIGLTASNAYANVWIPTNASQSIDYKNTLQTTGGVYIGVMGFCVTEVP
jgi:hypothetical protein